MSELDDFWDLIAGGPYVSNLAKATRMRSPVLRIVQKFLANTIFARRDSSQVKKDEVKMLFQATKHLVVKKDGTKFLNDFGTQVNLGCVLATEWVGIRRLARTTTRPHIYMSSMFTPLLHYIGVPMDLLIEDPARERLGHAYFRKCGVFDPHQPRDVYLYTYTNINGDAASIRLPNTAVTSLTFENIVFHHLGEAAQPISPPAASAEHELAPASSSSSPPRSPSPIHKHGEPPFSELRLPSLRSKPRTPRERMFYEAYKVQKKINSWTRKMIQKLHRKLKRTPGYVSSDDNEDETEVYQDEDERQHEEYQEEQEPPTFDQQAPLESFQPTAHHVVQGISAHLEYQPPPAYPTPMETDSQLPQSDLGGVIRPEAFATRHSTSSAPLVYERKRKSSSKARASIS